MNAYLIISALKFQKRSKMKMIILKTINDILNLIKEHDLTDMVKSEAEKELKLAKECLLNLEIDTRPLLNLTQFSVI
ncbi:MAG: hypothetical protein Ct9H300mP28_36520 [Pseudomonadota bacterium]|nr:MAG: hypothetical protein Ct9H300mP28_36520 [Pseudomonadota bacterium]